MPRCSSLVRVARRGLAVLALAALPALAAAQTLTVSAAASLTNAFKELGPKFEASHPGSKLVFNFAASGTLIQQIAQGAPVDVFASADQTTVTQGIEKKLFDADSKRDFALNTVVSVVPAQGGPALASVKDLAGAAVKRIAIGKTATVPVGRYTRESLDAAGLWATLEPKFVYADSVRQVLDYVARGEVDAGFVYRTDAAIGGDKVKIAFTATGHTPVSYPVVVVSESRQKPLAKAFIHFLSTPPALEVLNRYGFGQPS
ncbi:molybdate ABC transporter substrate-binding protein [Pseudacidovorax intermedius]|uniref:Molybdate ABC transporter substrate-binding protein n=1 Tax=Pseudacidovorax intermedius TaxID=433924 RepID=A0A147GR72_9BURK|nr:molybdate ABC transporter substrate-binding protein [Pseudacidovorax intermedius]KTT18135.1 molybdate ABC transporter substrate-binding protein [Pseudacidovorax intermedius]